MDYGDVMKQRRICGICGRCDLLCLSRGRSALLITYRIWSLVSHHDCHPGIDQLGNPELHPTLMASTTNNTFDDWLTNKTHLECLYPRFTTSWHYPSFWAAKSRLAPHKDRSRRLHHPQYGWPPAGHCWACSPKIAVQRLLKLKAWLPLGIEYNHGSEGRVWLSSQAKCTATSPHVAAYLLHVICIPLVDWPSVLDCGWSVGK